MPLKPFDGTLKQKKNKHSAAPITKTDALKKKTKKKTAATKTRLVLSVCLVILVSHCCCQYMPTWLALGLANHIGVWPSETVT